MTELTQQTAGSAGGAGGSLRRRRRAGGRHPIRSLEAQERRFGYTLVAPAVIALVAITAFPLVYNLWNSFHHVAYLSPPVGSFAGVSNYKTILTDNFVVPSLVRTLAFTVVSVALELVAGLALALALDRPFRGRGLVRAAVFIPWAVPTVVSAKLWQTMFDPQQGFVNYTLTALHLPLGHTTWLSQQWTAWAAILVADAWKNVPFMAILLLAGLQVIPRDMYEAARIDGASAWQAFRRLTLPLLKPALMVALIFRTLSAFLIFDVVYIMTGGGPGNSTNVLGFLNFQAFLVQTDFGYGGAVSVMLVLMAVIIAGAYVRVFRTDYEVTQ
jgi:multiple sugar transport system permease protein